MNPIGWIILAGIVAGIVRSIFGWAKSNEPFDGGKMLKSILRAAVGGAIVSYSLGIMDPVAAFFATLSTDVLAHDGYAAIKKNR